MEFDIDPLPVRTLRLGTSFTPYKNEAGDNYLSQLLRFEKLQDLHLWNGNYKSPTEDDDQQCTQIDWTLFDSSKILRMQLTILNEDVLEWLNEKKTVEELILVEHYERYNHGRYSIPELRLPNLKSFLIRDDVHSWVPHLPITAGADLDSDGGNDAPSAFEILRAHENQMRNRFASIENHIAESTKPVPEKISAVIWAANHNATPDPSIVQHATILDVFHDKGVGLEKLAISMHFETQFVSFLFTGFQFIQAHHPSTNSFTISKTCPI